MINVTNSDQEKILVAATLQNSLHNGLLVHEFSEKFSFHDAIEFCSNFRCYGISGWRIPSARELIDLKCGRAATMKDFLDVTTEYWSYNPTALFELSKTGNIRELFMNKCYRDRNKLLIVVNDILK